LHGSILKATFDRGCKILVCGNGGSAAMADHFAGEMVGTYGDRKRRALPCIALTSAASLTAIGNDFGYAETFARQVEAHGRSGDLLIAMSTSGRSENVIRAVAVAMDRGMYVLVLTGMEPDPSLAVQSDRLFCYRCEGSTGTIQQLHLEILHKMCAELDELEASK
jgi:phosphoheptose isomerase